MYSALIIITKKKDKNLKKSNYSHYRFVEIGRRNPMETLYGLGKSNSTSLPHGGVCIGTFLMKDGVIFNDSQNGEEADTIIYSICRASNKENYWRAKARKIVKGKALMQANVLYSKNYDYPTVLKVCDKLAELVELEFSKHKNVNQSFWNHFKNTFSIDSFVENGCQVVNTTVQIDTPLTAGMRGQ